MSYARAQIKKLKLLFLITTFCLPTAYSSETSFLPISKSDTQIINEYTAIHRRFFQTVCRPGTEQKYEKMEKKFRGDGHFIPLLPDDTLDKESIRKSLPELRNKITWIDQQIARLKKIESFNDLKLELTELEDGLAKLQDLKKDYDRASNQLDKQKAQISSKYALLAYKTRLLDFMEKIFFLKSFKAPVDHFTLRKIYDENKSSTEVAAKKKANETYFLRMLVQDGAQDKDLKRSDKFLRAMIDTLIQQSIDKTDEILLEDYRYDLESFFTMVDTQVERGVSQQLLRFDEWRDRTVRALEYYTALVADKVRVGDHFETAEQISQGRVQARYALRDFNFEKQVEVYKFWSKQTELVQALFAIETILYNEVGSLDKKEGVERRDITQIVLNRRVHDTYSKLTEKDGLFSYLKMSQEQINKYPWLNLLFKEGEFSFTYYFIGSSLRVYCPEMTRTGKWLRRQNLNIGLDLLRSPNPEFKALRYYSRHSMQARMRMDELWTNYQAIAERPGPVVLPQTPWKKRWEAGDYEYLYRFTSDLGRVYEVVEMSDETFSVSLDDLKFYQWRNPHYFLYFENLPLP